MIPKKAKDFISITAKKTECTEKTVAAVVNYYWKNVRKEIVEMNNLNVSIINFGTFKVKYWKLDETILKYNNAIKKIDGEFKKFNVKKKLEERIIVFENIKKQAEERQLKFDNIKKLRDEQSKKNMEQQESNLEGSNKQND